MKTSKLSMAMTAAILALSIPTAHAEDVSMLVCEGGKLTLVREAADPIYHAVVTDEEAIAYFVNNAVGEACGPNYYGGTACVQKQLPGNLSIVDGEMSLLGMHRSGNAFVAGQYRPMLTMEDGGIELSMTNGSMPNSHTFIRYSLGHWLFADCEVINGFPMGSVHVTVLADRIENGTLVSSPLRNVGVYRGNWHAGDQAAVTDAEGHASFAVVEGNNLQVSVFKMTSSHSALQSYDNYVNVEAGRTTPLKIHVAPTQVTVETSYDCGFGNAIYLTGDSDYLGNWQRAYRLNDQKGQWRLTRNLPLGAEFKLIVAPWTDERLIVVDEDVQWERGPNRVITPPMGYYESVIRADPAF